MIRHNEYKIDEWYDGAEVIHKAMHNGKRVFQRYNGIHSDIGRYKAYVKYVNGTESTVECGTAYIGTGYTSLWRDEIGASDMPNTTVKELTIGNCVKTVSNMAYLTSMTALTIADSVTSINTFSSATSLSKLKLGSGIKEYGAIFNNCTNLKTVTIPSTVTTLSGTFKNSGLETISYATTQLTEIGADTFTNCTHLKAINFPNSVIRLGNNAYSGCTAATSVQFGYGLEHIGYSTFRGCTSLKSVHTKNVNDMGYWAFADCTSLEKIVVGNDLTLIELGAFRGCSRLTTIEYEDVYNSNLTTLMNSAFANCDLRSITLPSSISTIEDGVFAFNYNLAEVTMLGTTPPAIGTNVFAYTSMYQMHLYLHIRLQQTGQTLLIR